MTSSLVSATMMRVLPAKSRLDGSSSLGTEFRMAPGRDDNLSQQFLGTFGLDREGQCLTSHREDTGVNARP